MLLGVFRKIPKPMKVAKILTKLNKTSLSSSCSIFGKIVVSINVRKLVASLSIS